MIYIIVLSDFVDSLMNRIKKFLDNNDIFANIGLVASTLCIIYVIPIDKEYSVSFIIVLWFIASIIKEYKDGRS